jgi:PAS domain S-box-containing protein
MKDGRERRHGPCRREKSRCGPDGGDACGAKLYRLVFEAAGTALVVIDGDDVILLANSHFENLSGYTGEELDGKMRWTSFAAAEDLERVKGYMERRRKDPSAAIEQCEFVFVDRMGSRRDILLNANMMPGTTRVVVSCMDVTQLKEAERSLKKSRQDDRNILESIQEAYYEVDLEGNFTFFNPRAWQALGYPEEALLGMNFRRYIHPDDVGRVFDTYHMVFLTGMQVGQVSFTVVKNDGTTLPVEASVSLRMDEIGSVTGFKGVVRDVSARMAYEAAIRESEGRYRDILESIQEGYYEVDLAGNFTFLNSSLSRILGYPASELLGASYRKCVDEGISCRIYETFHRVFLTGEPDKGFDWVIRRQDGGRRIIETSIELKRDDHERPCGFRGMCRDITERKEAEEALRASEERFRDLAELLPETVYEASLDGRITFVNEAGIERFGYTREEVVGQGVFIDALVHPCDRQRLSENLARVFSGEKTGLNEYTMVRRDGSVFSGLAHSSPIFRNDEVAGVRGFLVDITEKKDLEARFMHAQRMEAIGTLAGGVAHDFNNLLMGILGNVTLAMGEAKGKDRVFERLCTVERYVRRARELTRHLLGFAQEGKYEVKVTDMAEFVWASTDMFERTHRELRVHRMIAPGTYHVEVDRVQMEQVLLNLFLNAHQAMPRGGDLRVSVDRCELGPPHAALYDLSPGEYVRTVVSDSGEGMDDETMARIFDPFFTTKGQAGKTGLGLASVYGIVKNHGGAVGVRSARGKGTEFTMYLPVSGKPPASALDREERGAPAGHGAACVLLIDDDEMILEVVSEMLSIAGYKVITAQGGKAGLECYRLRGGEIDLVILDMVMPDICGREVFELLRAMDPGVKVLLSSGYALDSHAKEIMEKGCNGFIQKPYKVEEITCRIRSILDEDEEAVKLG